MNIDALVHNIFELHCEIHPYNKHTQIDKKIQEIIKQYQLLNPENHTLEEMYKKVNLSPGSHSPLYDDFLKVREFEKAIIKVVSEKLPGLDLNSQIKRIDRFIAACDKPEVLDGSDLSSLKSILKEGPINFKAIEVTIDDSPVKRIPVLTYVMNLKADQRLVAFLLKKGCVPNWQTRENLEAAFNYLLQEGEEERAHCCSDHLVDFLRAGYDINASFPSTDPSSPHAGQTLFSRALNHRNSKAMQNLIDHGAGNKDDDQTFKNLPLWLVELTGKAFCLRERMLDRMQKHEPQPKTCQDLSISEREHLAKLCKMIRKFHNELIFDVKDGEFTKFIAWHREFVILMSTMYIAEYIHSSGQQ